MKKFLLIFVSFVALISAHANAHEMVVNDDVSMNYSLDISDSSQLLTYDYNQLVDGTIEVLVWANSAADDLCNYFSGSWGDVILTIYCASGGDVYTCTAYKVVQAACTVNGAIKLVIEGKYDAAARKALIGATKIFSISKANSNHYILRPSQSR